MVVHKQQLLYRGKVKSIYETNGPDLFIAEFHDKMTAFDGEKHQTWAGKGAVNNQISAKLMTLLTDAGIPTHFERLLSDHESVVKRLKMLPVECVVRNRAAGSVSRRLGIEKNTCFDPPLYEFFLKNDALHDPLISEHHILYFHWATKEQVEKMISLALQINGILVDVFQKKGLLLIDAKYEFGLSAHDQAVTLGDEISPDSCRIWNQETQKPLDKDRFRYDMGQVLEAYREIAKRLGIRLL